MKRAWRIAAWCVGGATLSGGALLACVLADPPPLQQPPPPARPIIIGSTASPPLGMPIGVQPSDQGVMTFAVNVQVDPNQTLLYRVFVDYGDPINGRLVYNTSKDTSGSDGGVPVPFQIAASDLGDPTQCHFIELDVATSGWTDPSGPSNVAVYPPGGDSAVWIYQPTGNCNVFDAGSVPPPDASDASDASDAGDGATE